MKFPEDLKYSKNHEWIRVEGSIAYVGITDYAQHELGEVIFVEITTEGDSLGRHERFGNIEAVKTVSDLFIPVAAEVLRANPELETNPELVNKDPYGKGWMIKIEPTNKEEDLNTLMTAAEYKAFVGK